MNLTLVVLALGCAGGDPLAPPRLLAAASLGGVLDGICGDRVAITYASSATLARQLRWGAPGAVWIAADAEWLDRVHGQRPILARALFCQNRLVVVARSPTPALEFHALAQTTGRVAVADPEAVPAGRYARQALENAGIWESLEPRLVPAADVRAALRAVETGAVAYGIVYQTDVQFARGVRVVAPVPQALAPEIRYEMALMDDGPEARALFDCLRGDGVRQQLAALGFGRDD